VVCLFKNGNERHHHAGEGEGMTAWQEVMLKDVVSILGDGLHGTPEYDDNGEYYFINGNNLNNGKIVIKESTRRASKEEFDKYKKNLNDRTILVSINGTIGNVATYNNEKCILGKSACYFNVIDNVEKDFIFYVATSNQFQTYISEFANGTTIKNVPLKAIREYSFFLPEYSEQKVIAAILSSLDDKIDLLHRQNQTLEAMAATLFRQWFVEEAQEDWEDVELGSVVETISGGTPSRSKMEFYENGTINWVKSKELLGSFVLDTEEKITVDALKNSSAKLLPANSILIAMYGATVGEYAIIPKEMCCNQAVCALKPSQRYPYTFLFSYVKTFKSELINMAAGSAQQNISQLLIKQLPIPTCHEKIGDFHLATERWFRKIKNNIRQIRTLEKLRDTLLPKLMSGEVRVEV
jgi:type I restriction enzyme S subunit